MKLLMIWFIGNLYDCYGNKNVKVSFTFSEDKKIRRIDLDFGIIFNTRNKDISINDIIIDEIISNSNGKYSKIKKQLEKNIKHH